MANSEIYFPMFSKTIHTILKIFSQHMILGTLGKGYCKKNMDYDGGQNIQLTLNFMAPFYGWGSTASIGQSHFEEAVLPLMTLTGMTPTSQKCLEFGISKVSNTILWNISPGVELCFVWYFQG